MIKGRNFSLQCSYCGKRPPFGAVRCTCGLGILKPIIKLPSKKDGFKSDGELGIWNYQKVLPEVTNYISQQEGHTPLLSSRKLGRELGIDLVYKDETRNPTGSFKDRAASVMLSVSKERGLDKITTASSGNAAGAIALYSRLAEIEAYIFMYKPSEQKLIQTLSFGANVLIVKTPNEGEVLNLTEKAAKTFDWALLNTTTAANPMVAEGYKTIAYELYDGGINPDWISVPVSSGSLLIGIWQGYCELRDMGYVNSPPKLLGIQSYGISPIVEAFKKDREKVTPTKHGDTIATALSLEDPGVSGIETLRSVRASSGDMLPVKDELLIDTTRRVAGMDGVYGEPSGVISVAGVIKGIKEGVINKGDTVVCLITGGGLKDSSAFQGEGAPRATTVENNINAVARIIQGINK